MLTGFMLGYIRKLGRTTQKQDTSVLRATIGKITE